MSAVRKKSDVELVREVNETLERSRRPMTADSAIDSVHTYTMRDGTVVTTTWHDTKKAASARIAKPAIATFRKVFHEPRSALGAYRAVTWSVAR